MKAGERRRVPTVRASIMRGAAALLALGLAALLPFEFAAQSGKIPSPSSRRVVAANRMAPNQAYSPGILAGKSLYLAGQLGRDPETQQLPPGIRDQTRHAMDNIGAVLRDAGMGHDN